MLIEAHILQAFPTNCLNRDDTNSPKTVRIGGVTRARVSSQCWKRQVRQALPQFGVKIGTHSRQIAKLLVERIRAQNASGEIAAAAAEDCAKALAEQIGANNMVFLSDAEIDDIALLARDAGWDPKKITKAGVEKLRTRFAKNAMTHDGLDIALFGRMLAKNTVMNVEAASSFSHAYTTHAVASGLDFFTAVDDLDPAGPTGHMGVAGYTAGVFYRYVCLDVTQLAETLGLTEEKPVLADAVRAFVKALYVAVPQARQHGMAAFSPWAYAHFLVRDGWPLQAGFEKPVQERGGSGLLIPSIAALESELALQEKLSGSLYGKKSEYLFGAAEGLSIDALADALAKEAEAA